MVEQPSLFDIASWQRAPFGRWVHHAGTVNSERRIAHWLCKPGILWLTSDHAVAGKSHLLYEVKNSCAQLAVITVNHDQNPEKETATTRVARWLKMLQGHKHWAVDIASGPVDATTGEALFHLLEHVRADGQGLLIVWFCPDAVLSPPELASRLRMIEQTRVSPPSNDSALQGILQAVANNMHWNLPQSVLSTMISHTERSLAHQIHVLHKLEIESRNEGVRTTQRWVCDQLGRLTP